MRGTESPSTRALTLTLTLALTPSRTLTRHGVTIDLRRDDYGGERLLSLSGGVQQVYSAAAEVLEDKSTTP